jgi:hypothetical protein
MKTIKIDRSTIEKNPNVGNTRTYLQGNSHATFEIESEEIPQWLSEEPFYPTEWSLESDSNGMNSMKGEISGMITEEMIEKFKITKGLHVNISKEPIVIDHMPEPDYLYEYEETTLKCKHCKSKVNGDDIETDWEDDYPIKVCPVCRRIDSFPEYRYEKIEDALKSEK